MTCLKARCGEGVVLPRLVALMTLPWLIACSDEIDENNSGIDRTDRSIATGNPEQEAAATQPMQPTQPTLDMSVPVLAGDTAATGLAIDTASSAGGGAGGAEDEFVECFGEESEAVDAGLDIFMIVDHTGSMGEDCPLDLVNGPGTNLQEPKWCYTTHALAQYFMSPEAEDNRVALQFMTVENDFANISEGDENYVCDAEENNPHAVAAVELTELPVDAASQLVTTLDQDGPVTGLGTRIEAALLGITRYTAAAKVPDREMIGVLITDGDPTGCDTNISNLAQIAADHLAATGIRTFIVGMTGATLGNLETLAVAGGAEPHAEWCGTGPGAAGDMCHYFNVGDGDPAAFVQALQDIQEAAVIPCEYAVPAPPPGEVLNPDKVNVLYVDEAGSESTFGRVADAAACAGGSGWYYDDPASPSTIQLCEATCATATSAATGARLKVSIGCDSVLR